MTHAWVRLRPTRERENVPRVREKAFPAWVDFRPYGRAQKNMI